MISTRPISPARSAAWLSVFFLALGLLALPARGETGEGNRLLRVQARPHRGFTRITLIFSAPPDCTLTRAGSQVRLQLKGTASPTFRKLRSYSDQQVGGIFCSSRDGGTLVVVPVKQAGAGVQLVSCAAPEVLALEVGPALNRPQRADIAPGREPILSGTEQFVKSFGAPSAALPFAPTDSELLKQLLPPGEVLLFQRGEGALYKEQGSEALEVFSWFLNKAPAVKALATYRLAQALYLLERHDEALKAFKEAERLWPAYLEHAPALVQSYADARSRAGDYAGGRQLLARLVERMAGTSYCAPLLNRLADMAARHGNPQLALEIYRSVAERAPGTSAAARARMKLADREMFSLSRDRYRELLKRYQEIYQAPGDFALRDEALFKMALLQALYGPAREALAAAVAYQNCYPRGIFATIVKKMREEILVPVYREIAAKNDDRALARLALDNRDYLARCLADPEFAPKVAKACRDTGMLAQGVSLFEFLAERSWAGASAQFILSRLTDDALTLGNLPLARVSAKSFLSRFPAAPGAQRMHEQLGRIAFAGGDLKGVVPELGFLNLKGRQAEIGASDYYLGKALLQGGDLKGAERALARFGARGASGGTLLPDGFLALAGARTGLKEYPGALDAYREGLKFATGETAGQFLYQMGELHLRLGQVREAKGAWEEAVKKGGDGTWGKLASTSLGDLSWRLKIAGELR